MFDLRCSFWELRSNLLIFTSSQVKIRWITHSSEYCSRGSLSSILTDASMTLTKAQQLSFAIDAAQGMLYLHSNNPPIIHRYTSYYSLLVRDLKCENLLVDQNFTVKVCDFGISRFVTNQSTMTHCGTTHICAPEVIANARYGIKADVYPEPAEKSERADTVLESACGRSWHEMKRTKEWVLLQWWLRWYKKI